MISGTAFWPRRRSLARWSIAASLLVAIVALTGIQSAGAEKKAEEPAGAAASPAMPDAYRLNLLIRTTLIALSQANQTGNYTVLRDLASPSFQRANSAARLGEIFAGLRQRNIDLSPVMFFEPKLIRPPQFNDAGMLRLSGFIPSEPERVLFDFLFQSVDNRWQLFGISVDVRPSEAAKSQSKEPAGAHGRKTAQPEKDSGLKSKK